VVQEGGFHLIEACAGSAALTMHLLGAKRQVVPYQGNKWKVRKGLAQVLSERGFTKLSSVLLNDIGPWGNTWRALRVKPLRKEVASRLEAMQEFDPRKLFDQIQGRAVPDSLIGYAVEHLFLQRLSISGKAVGDQGDVWKSPGFNKTSAYGKDATGRFGAVRPMIPSLVEVLRGMDELEWPSEVETRRARASWLRLHGHRPVVVYIDPPYVNSTGYPNGQLPRHAVEELALSFHLRGATVMVSEAEPLDRLMLEGWQAICLRTSATDGKPFHTKKAEWVTVSPKGGPK
jgi:hypothetical protein